MNSHDDGELGSLPAWRERAALPPLGALRCFEAAARLGSFTRAARELHLTHGAVSRAVRSIEDALGVALFERRNQRVHLTAAGARLRDAAAGAFELLAATVRELREPPRKPALVVSCEPTLLMRWLIPRLPAFQAAHPGIALQWSAGGGPVGFGEVDLAIRRNDFAWGRDVHAQHLFDERVGPVCSPAYRAGHVAGAGRSARFGAGVCLLHSATRAGAWSEWARAARRKRPAAAMEQTFEHFYFSLQAAAAGVGVAIGPWQLVRDEIESGVLAAPLGFVADGSAYYLLSPTPARAGSPAALLAQWLRAQA
ncbi:LysR substrate-binding domain-containing protein [Lysobacter enzymogenes]|uniref:LysR substrate-binding domain-containing protein n=1 Tax=Lysobacter enzymogenes TaxID=69 RepID=UPI0008978527|nr:LysR substrate-binding domain-containing protein [Lysobacter enzymogenes]SDX53855.1 DNA-binding transcriptional regulator, LysR family [Lysobacter enzymogenes]